MRPAGLKPRSRVRIKRFVIIQAKAIQHAGRRLRHETRKITSILGLQRGRILERFQKPTSHLLSLRGPDPKMNAAFGLDFRTYLHTSSGRPLFHFFLSVVGPGFAVFPYMGENQKNLFYKPAWLLK